MLRRSTSRTAHTAQQGRIKVLHGRGELAVWMVPAYTLGLIYRSSSRLFQSFNDISHSRRRNTQIPSNLSLVNIIFKNVFVKVILAPSILPKDFFFFFCQLFLECVADLNRVVTFTVFYTGLALARNTQIKKKCLAKCCCWGRWSWHINIGMTSPPCNTHRTPTDFSLCLRFSAACLSQTFTQLTLHPETVFDGTGGKCWRNHSSALWRDPRETQVSLNEKQQRKKKDMCTCLCIPVCIFHARHFLSKSKMILDE